MTETTRLMIRVRAGRMATPVDFYRNQRTGRRLALILNNHIGSGAYWATMLARIEDLEDRGWAVHREGIREAPATEWALATPAEQAARQVMLGLFRDLPKLVAAQLGWVAQPDGLASVKDRWPSSDMTDLDVIRAAGTGTVLALGRAVEAGLAKAGRHREAYLAAIMPLAWRAMARPRYPGSQAVRGLAPDVYGVLLDQRSQHAAAQVDPDRDAVMLWGAGHDDTIRPALGQDGWAATGRRLWLEVGRLPSPPRSFAQVAAVARAAGVDAWKAAQDGQADPAAMPAWARRAGLAGEMHGDRDG